MVTRVAGQDVPPAMLANPLLINMARPPGDAWWCCQACNLNQERREYQRMHVQVPVSTASPEDGDAWLQDIAEWRQLLQLLLDLPPGVALQLGVVLCGVRFAQRICGFLHMLSAADVERPPLMRGPLIVWHEAADADVDQLASALQRLIDHLEKTHPAVQRFLTMAERHWSPQAAGLPMLPSSALDGTVHRQRTRDPRSHAAPYSLTAALDCEEQDNPEERTTNVTMFHLGSAVPRTAITTEIDVLTDHRGISPATRLSVDTALLPYLHPRGLGGYRRRDSLSDVLRQRIQQLFSPFTLCKEYLLVMFQVGYHGSTAVDHPPQTSPFPTQRRPPTPRRLSTRCACAAR